MKNDETAVNNGTSGNPLSRPDGTTLGRGRENGDARRERRQYVKIKLHPAPSAPRKATFPPMTFGGTMSFSGAAALRPSKAKPWWKFW